VLIDDEILGRRAGSAVSDHVDRPSAAKGHNADILARTNSRTPAETYERVIRVIEPGGEAGAELERTVWGVPGSIDGGRGGWRGRGGSERAAARRVY